MQRLSNAAGPHHGLLAQRRQLDRLQPEQRLAGIASLGPQSGGVQAVRGSWHQDDRYVMQSGCQRRRLDRAAGVRVNSLRQQRVDAEVDQNRHVRLRREELHSRIRRVVVAGTGRKSEVIGIRTHRGVYDREPRDILDPRLARGEVRIISQSTRCQLRCYRPQQAYLGPGAHPPSAPSGAQVAAQRLPLHSNDGRLNRSRRCRCGRGPADNRLPGGLASRLRHRCRLLGARKNKSPFWGVEAPGG